MPSEKITAFNQAAVETINRKLETFDLQQKQIATMRSTLNLLQTSLTTLQAQRQTVGANNLLFTWAGGSLTIAWASGYIQDTRGGGNTTVPVAAGSQVVAASTEYWIGYNPSQQQMSFQANLPSLTNIPNIIVVCRLLTGGGGDSGPAGGGGTETSGSGALGKEYTLF
jgi:hypothetical protein